MDSSHDVLAKRAFWFTHPQGLHDLIMSTVINSKLFTLIQNISVDFFIFGYKMPCPCESSSDSSFQYSVHSSEQSCKKCRKPRRKPDHCRDRSSSESSSSDRCHDSSSSENKSSSDFSGFSSDDCRKKKHCGDKKKRCGDKKKHCGDKKRCGDKKKHCGCRSKDNCQCAKYKKCIKTKCGFLIISLAKEADVEYFVRAGQIITYTYKICNMGTEKLRYPIHISDDVLGYRPLCKLTIDAGQCIEVPWEYRTTEKDVKRGYVKNNAVVYAQVDRCTYLRSSPVSVTVKYMEVQPSAEPEAEPQPEVV